MNKKLFLRLLGPVIFVAVIFFYVDLNQLKKIGMGLKWWFFFLSVMLVPALIFVRSIRWRGVLIKYGISYSKWKCFRIYFVEMVAIMVMATIGTFVKAVYPKRDGYGLLRPALSILGDKYYDYLLPLLFGVTSAVVVSIGFSPQASLIILLFVICATFVPARKAMGMFLPLIISARLKGVFLKKGWKVAEHIAEFEKALDWKTYALSVAGFTIYYLCVYLLNRGIGVDLSLSQVILVMAITSLITMIPISFFGVGTRDIGLIAVFRWFGRPPEEAVALSMALLLLRMAIVLMGSVFWFTDPPPLMRLEEA